MQQSVLIQIAGSGRVPLDPKPELVERLSRRGSLENKEALEQRLQRAERNRQVRTRGAGVQAQLRIDIPSSCRQQQQLRPAR